MVKGRLSCLVNPPEISGDGAVGIWKGGPLGLASTLGNKSVSSGSATFNSGGRPSVCRRGRIHLAWLRHSAPHGLSVLAIRLLVASGRSLCQHPGSDDAAAAYSADHAACTTDRLKADRTCPQLPHRDY